MALVFILATAMVAPAAPAQDLSEEEIPPSGGAPVLRLPRTLPIAPKSTVPRLPTSISRQPLPAGAPEAAPKVHPATDAGSPTAPGLSGGEFNYTVSRGETLSMIAQQFHVDAAELARLNHIPADTMVRIGQTLKIPNPYASETRRLGAQVGELNAELEQMRRKLDAATAQTQSMHERTAEESAVAANRLYDARVLPWWRAAAIGAGGACAAMLVLLLVGAIDYLRIRAGFRTLAAMNESLRRLDQKYKAILAKAELRFQQIYGRRRLASGDGQDVGKTAEEQEIDRLNSELKELLKSNLRRLSPSASKRGRRQADSAATVRSAIEARSIRR
jgi:murein DD-endopeptidase MepM/ murein hydrolase activator NlpD